MYVFLLMRSIALTKLASAKRDTFEHLTSTRD
jgi:hypothetical protein